MNSDEIYGVIEQIAKAKGKQKAAIISEHLDDEHFVDVLRHALSPFITFGIAKRPDAVPGPGDKAFDEITWGLLGELAERTLTGTAAINAVAEEMARLTPDSRELLWRIITKDLRAGFTANTVNRVKKGLVPKFDCMLAHKFEEKHVKTWPVYVEPKLDGVRVLCLVRGQRDVTFYSRTGKEFATFEHLKPHVIDLMECMARENLVFDGEVVSGSFNKTVSEVRRSSEQAVGRASRPSMPSSTCSM